MANLGKRNRLSIVRASGPELYLDGGKLGEILLPGYQNLKVYERSTKPSPVPSAIH